MTKTARRTLLIALPFLFAACARNNDPAKTGDTVQKITGLKMFEIKNGAPIWTLTASKADIYDNKAKAFLWNPAIIFTSSGAVTSKITALEGQLDINTKDMVLEKSVKAESVKEKAVLETKKLNYSSGRDKLWTDEKVFMTQNGATIKGSGMKATADLSEVVIQNQETTLPEDKKNQ